MASTEQPLPDFAALLAQLSAIGSTGDGGVDRVEGSPANGEARRWLVARMQEHGFTVSVDAIGNIFGRIGPKGRAVMTGSHIDSQPKGGRLDGAYGVLASLVAARAVAARGGLKRGLVVVAWTGEEGARFQPSLVGSSVYAGTRALDWTLARRDGDGISVAEALDGIGFRGTDPAPPHPAAYVELHVECASELERKGARLGVFDAWWGAHKLEVEIAGATSHTGPTPMAERRDALAAAAEVIVHLRKIADRARPGTLHTSVGRLEVVPNSPNVVPGRVTMFVELRSASAAIMAKARRSLDLALERACSGLAVSWKVRRDELRPPGRFAPRLRTLARETAGGLGHEPLPLSTIAAHDAMPLATVCPSLVIAVPSREGLCHSPREWTDPADLQLGVDWLTAMLDRLTRG
ncbi:MAG: Zn-dependent hydrolase [Geminicoccaceae bacterium]